MPRNLQLLPSPEDAEPHDATKAESFVRGHGLGREWAAWQTIQRLWLDYAITYLTTVGIMATGVLTYRLASLNFGEEGLSEYALVRRVIFFLQPILALGASVALSRKVAECKFRTRNIGECAYLLAALILVLASTLAFLVPLFLFPKFFAYAFFGSEHYYEHALALAPMLIGLDLHIVCYAQLHGRFSMRLANAVQLLNIGLIPLVIVACSSNISATFFWTGLVVSLVSLVGIATQFRLRRAGTESQAIIPALIELLRFGPARVPGDLAFAAILMLPAIMVTHTSSAYFGGLVAFCITLLTIAQSTTTPISTILLPQATELLRSGKIEELRSSIVLILTVGSGITALGILLFWVASDLVLRICLGQYAAELPNLGKLIVLAALPLNCHTCLRSVVDAGKEQAVNARSSCLALGCYFLVWFLARNAVGDLYAAPLALVVALFCLAGLSSWEVWQILKPTSEWAKLNSQQLESQAA